VALVVVEGNCPEEVCDRWAVAAYDLKANKGQVSPLDPRDIAGTWSVAGFGIAAPHMSGNANRS